MMSTLIMFFLGLIAIHIIVLCLLGLLWEIRKDMDRPSFTDIDLMVKYGVEYPELKRMKKAGIV